MEVAKMASKEKLRTRVAKKLGIAPSEVEIDTFQGTLVIKEEAGINQKQCEQLLKGEQVQGVGCVTETEELPDGSLLYHAPALKVMKGKKGASPREKEADILRDLERDEEF